MKVIIDIRPAKNNPPFFAIRLFPETNKEMSELEWGENLFKVDEYKRCQVGDELFYGVIFKRKE